MDKANCGIYDHDEIGKSLDQMRLRENAYFNRLCFNKTEGLKEISMQCWCRKAGPNGSDLQCP